MLYQFKSMDKHVDLGYGITADSFYAVAKNVYESIDNMEVSPFIPKNLPVLYLFRHSCELFLKSCILNFHIALNINWKPHKRLSYVFKYDGKHPISIKNCHSLQTLYIYLLEVLEVNNTEIKRKYPNGNWDYIKEIEEEIEFITDYDSKSDYFRYPISSNELKDLEKQIMRNIPTEEIEEHIVDDKLTAFHVVVNSDGDPVEFYKAEKMILTELENKITNAAELLHSFYLQTRHNLQL